MTDAPAPPDLALDLAVDLDLAALPAWPGPVVDRRSAGPRPALALPEMPRVTPAWLGRREGADAAARAEGLVELLRPYLPGGTLVIHDLGCGTGSMGRWLAPRLAGPQHWVLHDRDPALLPWAAAAMPVAAADGAPVTVETRAGDATRLTARDLAGAALVTTSAVLDLLTAAELDRIAAACRGAGCAALHTLSVVGRVELSPAEPFDVDLNDAFNAHQRRTVAGRPLLGPDAVSAVVDACTTHGAATIVRPSPWGLDAGCPELLDEWLAGWLEAAVEHRPDLAEPVLGYTARRRAQARAGRLRVAVHHEDVLALND
jgi:hypothetical protein